MLIELKKLAAQIRDWQLAQNLSDGDLIKRFAGLGSTKTYKRILAGETEELDLERWATEYQQVWSLIEMASQDAEADDPIYDDLLHMSRARDAVRSLINARGNNRFVLIEGPSGAGKTTAARHLATRFGRKFVLAEADETWKESLAAMLAGLLRAVGFKELPQAAAAMREKLIDKLRETPACLVIDEAHHLGPKTLNLIKTLLNQTSCVIVFLAIGTLFRRLETSAYEEARQLLRNRLHRRLRLEGCPDTDVSKFLRKRFDWTDEKTVRNAAALLAKRAVEHGYWNFVNLVAGQIQSLTDKPVTDQVFIEALDAAAATR